MSMWFYTLFFACDVQDLLVAIKEMRTLTHSYSDIQHTDNYQYNLEVIFWSEMYFTFFVYPISLKLSYLQILQLLILFAIGLLAAKHCKHSSI